MREDILALEDVEKAKTSLRVINAHYQACSNHRIDLQRLNEIVGENGKLHRGRPTMLSCRMMTKRVQFFPSGRVQVLGGGVTPFLLSHLFRKVYYLLKKCNSSQLIHLTPWKVNNLVCHFDFGKRIKFEHMMCNKEFSYEPELFPAALISKWQPAHVTLFPNGKGMLTGIKCREKAFDILCELPHFLESNVNLHR